MDAASRDELCFLSAVELRRRIARAEVSPVEVVEAFLERIEERNPGLGAYVTLLPERAASGWDRSMASRRRSRTRTRGRWRASG
jgi:Asp-tRNA(Asn)/Glu-tRNA(Gln) amidotransferase A subunit family amidase